MRCGKSLGEWDSERGERGRGREEEGERERERGRERSGITYDRRKDIV